jgi:hypothetical protein
MDYIKLLNKFIQIFNLQYGGSDKKNKSLFDGIDETDEASTNLQHEIFYMYIKKHSELEKENSNYINIYNIDKEIDNDKSYDIFVIINKNKEPLLMSLSFMSLLFHGVSNIIDNDWSIIKL